MTAKVVQPFPPSARLIGSAGRFDSLAWDGAELLWCASRGGRGQLWRARPGQPPHLISGEINLGGRVHYGGGEFSARQGVVIAAARDGGLYRLLPGQPPERLPTPRGASAAPVLSLSGQRMVFIHSDGQTDGLFLWESGAEQVTAIATGAGFFMQPAWQPDETALAWVEWQHPHLPWTHSRLALANLPGSASPRLSILRDEPGCSFQQPEFSPDGRWLACLRSAADGDSLELLDLASGHWQALTSEPGAVLCLPAWLQGQRSFAWAPDSQSLVFTRYAQARAQLWQVSLANGETRPLPNGPFTWFHQPCASPDGRLACLASAADLPPQVLLLAGSNWEVIAEADPPPAPGQYPTPRPLDIPTVHATFYPPVRPAASPLPPAVVHLHSGPTRLAGLEYDPEILFFTSRGIGWLSVNYRGSAGFGRAYQEALHGRWGEADVADAAAAVQALAASGWADPARLALYGSSAGGLTVLNTLIHHPGLARAAVCKYPVCELLSLNDSTHKFELHYNDWLLGKLPEAAHLYRERSPLYRAAEIRTPLALFHGGQDPVVPLAQSRQIAAAVQSAGGQCRLTVYPQEGHGLRQAETLQDFYARFLEFLGEQGITGD